MSIIMRATLHDHAPNTYNEQWPGGKMRFAVLDSQAIAHNGLAASARVGTLDGTERDFPGNRSPARWKLVCRPKRKSSRQATRCASSADPVAHRFSTKPTALQALRQLVLPLKECRMQSAVGRSGCGMLCDLRVLGAVSGDHQHDVIQRNGFQRPALQQFVEDVFRLALGSGDPVSQGVEHVLRPGVECPVIAGNIVCPESL